MKNYFTIFIILLYLCINKLFKKIVYNLKIKYRNHYFKELNNNELLLNLYKYPYHLKLIKYQTEEMCLAALKRNAFALQYINDKTEYLCYFALSKNRLALKFVPDELVPTFIDMYYENSDIYFNRIKEM